MDSAGKWRQDFKVQVDLLVSAEAATCGRVDGAQAPLLKPPDRTESTTEIILEKRKRATGQTFAPCDITIEGQRVLLVERDILLVLVAAADIPGIAANAPFCIHPLVPARIGHQSAVTRIPRPAQRQRHAVTGETELVCICGVCRRQQGTRNDLGTLEAGSEIHRIGFGKRHTETQTGTGRHQLVAIGVAVGAGIAMVDIDRPGYPVDGEIGVGRIEDDGTVDFAGIELHAQ